MTGTITTFPIPTKDLSDLSALSPLLGTDKVVLTRDGAALALGTISDLLALLGTPTSFIPFFFPGKPINAQIIVRYVAAGQITLPAGLTGSKLVAKTAATADASIPLYKNGVSIGSGNWAAGATVGTFTFPSQVVLNPGDILEPDNQAIADATLADISMTLRGALTG